MYLENLFPASGFFLRVLLVLMMSENVVNAYTTGTLKSTGNWWRKQQEFVFIIFVGVRNHTAVRTVLRDDRRGRKKGMHVPFKIKILLYTFKFRSNHFKISRSQ